MVYKCSEVNCQGNYSKERQCKVYRLPKDEAEKQDWINKIPSFRPSLNYRICEKHWPEDAKLITVTGGYFRPAVPPSVFNVPLSCLQHQSHQHANQRLNLHHKTVLTEKMFSNHFLNFLLRRNCQESIVLFDS